MTTCPARAVIPACGEEWRFPYSFAFSCGLATGASLFSSVPHADADGQADNDGADDNNEKCQILHNILLSLG